MRGGAGGGCLGWGGGSLVGGWQGTFFSVTGFTTQSVHVVIQCILGHHRNMWEPLGSLSWNMARVNHDTEDLMPTGRAPLVLQLLLRILWMEKSHITLYVLQPRESTLYRDS